MIVSELQYFPPITFVSALYRETYVILDIYEPYRKMSFRNRCMIAGAQGIISLSVPLQEGRNQRLAMKEVLISNTENWQARHIKSLQSAYNRSPFFEYYQDELVSMYNKSFRYLSEWNLDCLYWLKDKLDWPAEIRLSEKTIPYQSSEYEDRRNRVLPKNYNQWSPLKYRQVFEERTGFFPNLSILDLLINRGPDSKELLRNSLE